MLIRNERIFGSAGIWLQIFNFFIIITILLCFSGGKSSIWNLNFNKNLNSREGYFFPTSRPSFLLSSDHAPNGDAPSTTHGAPAFHLSHRNEGWTKATLLFLYRNTLKSGLLWKRLLCRLADQLSTTKIYYFSVWTFWNCQTISHFMSLWQMPTTCYPSTKQNFCNYLRFFKLSMSL